MTLEQAKEKNNDASMFWLWEGMPEAYDKLNDSNRDIIKAYLKEFPNAKGYKFHKGIIDLKSEKTLYNFCCDYVFNGTPENITKIQAAEKAPNAFPKRLQNILEEANGICLLWS